MSDRRSPGEPANGNRGRIVALIAVVLLAAVLYGVGQAVVHHNALQNCIDSGRRDCDQRLNNP